MQIGFIGLGKMGSRMARKLLNEGHGVTVWNRSSGVSRLFVKENPKAKSVDSIEDLIKSLPKPRIIWVMVPASAVEGVLGEYKKHLEEEDIVIDGGNSHYKDTDLRYDDFENWGCHYLGIGISGGILAEKNGYPMMVGGSKKGYAKIRPILDSLAKPRGGHEYFGTGGAGHFVKMVHNGIEYGMMQSIGEGFEVLEKSRYKFDLSKIARLWQKGTIISGFLIDRAADELNNDVGLSGISGVIPRGGEGDWAVEAAREEGLVVEVIDDSVAYRARSETDAEIQNSFTARMINAMRHAFGGHQVKK